MEKLQKEAVAIPLSIVVKAIKKAYGNRTLTMGGDWWIAEDDNTQHSLILNAKEKDSTRRISFGMCKKVDEDYLKFYSIGENLQEKTKLCYQLLGSQIAIYDDMNLMGSGKHNC